MVYILRINNKNSIIIKVLSNVLEPLLHITSCKYYIKMIDCKSCILSKFSKSKFTVLNLRSKFFGRVLKEALKGYLRNFKKSSPLQFVAQAYSKYLNCKNDFFVKM